MNKCPHCGNKIKPLDLTFIRINGRRMRIEDMKIPPAQRIGADRKKYQVERPKIWVVVEKEADNEISVC